MMASNAAVADLMASVERRAGLEEQNSLLLRVHAQLQAATRAASQRPQLEVMAGETLLQPLLTYLFDRRYGWSERRGGPSGNEAEQVFTAMGEYKDRINATADAVLRALLGFRLSAPVLSVLTVVVRTTQKAVVRQHALIHTFDWCKALLSPQQTAVPGSAALGDRSLSSVDAELAQDLFVLGVTDVWSAIRKACAGRLFSIVDRFPLAWVEALFQRLVRVCLLKPEGRLPQHTWQAQEGAVLGITSIIKRFRCVGAPMSNPPSPISRGGSATSGGAALSSPRCLSEQPGAHNRHEDHGAGGGLTFGALRVSSLPDVISASMGDVAYTLLSHAQLSVRANTIKAFASFLKRSGAHQTLRVLGEVLVKLRRPWPMVVPQQTQRSSRETVPLSPYEAEGLLGLCVILIRVVPSRFVRENWKSMFGTLKRYLAHEASTVRQMSSTALRHLATKVPPGGDTGSNSPLMVLLLEELVAGWQLPCLPPMPEAEGLDAEISAESTVSSTAACSVVPPLTWQWKEGRLLTYELLLSHLLANHLHCLGNSAKLPSRDATEEAAGGKPPPLAPSATASTPVAAKTDPTKGTPCLQRRSAEASAGVTTPQRPSRDSASAVRGKRGTERTGSSATTTAEGEPSPGTPFSPFATPRASVPAGSAVSSGGWVKSSPPGVPTALPVRPGIGMMSAESAPSYIQGPTSTLDIFTLGSRETNSAFSVLCGKMLAQVMACFAETRFELRRMADQVLPLLVKIAFWTTPLPPGAAATQASDANTFRGFWPISALWTSLPRLVSAKHRSGCRLVAETLRESMGYAHELEAALPIDAAAVPLTPSSKGDIAVMRRIQGFPRIRAIHAMNSVRRALVHAFPGICLLLDAPPSSERMAVVTAELAVMLHSYFTTPGTEKTAWAPPTDTMTSIPGPPRFLPVVIAPHHRRTQVASVLDRIDELHACAAKMKTAHREQQLKQHGGQHEDAGWKTFDHRRRDALLLERTLSRALCPLLEKFAATLEPAESIRLLPHLLRWLDENVDVDPRLNILRATKVVLLRGPLEHLSVRRRAERRDVAQKCGGDGQPRAQDDASSKRLLVFSEDAVEKNHDCDSRQADAEGNADDAMESALGLAVKHLAHLLQSPALETPVLRQLLDVLRATCNAAPPVPKRFASTFLAPDALGEGDEAVDTSALRLTVIRAVAERMREHCPLSPPCQAGSPIRGAHEQTLERQMRELHFRSNDLSPASKPMVASPGKTSAATNAMIAAIAEAGSGFPSSSVRNSASVTSRIGDDAAQSPLDGSLDASTAGSSSAGSDWDDWDSDGDEGGLAGADGLLQEFGAFLNHIVVRVCTTSSSANGDASSGGSTHSGERSGTGNSASRDSTWIAAGCAALRRQGLSSADSVVLEWVMNKAQ